MFCCTSCCSTDLKFCWCPGANRGTDESLDAAQHERSRELQTGVEKERADHRFVDPGAQGARNRPAVAHSLAEHDEVGQPQIVRHPGAGVAADDRRLDLGQVAFLQLGVMREEILAHDQSEHGVAKKLQPLVARQPVVGGRGMRQGQPQERAIDEGAAQNGLRPGDEIL